MERDVIVTGTFNTGSEVVGFVQVCVNGYYVPVCGGPSSAGLNVIVQTACNNLGFSE